MFKKPISTSAIFLCLGLLVAAPAIAQSPPNPGGPNDMTQRHQMMSGMMKDMAQQMSAMADQMGRGDTTADQATRMGHQMDRMSGMMHRMSGMAAKPKMHDSDFQKQMRSMRQQMNQMMGGSSMMGTPPANPGTK